VKPEIEHVQNVQQFITAETAQQAVSLAADQAQLALTTAQIKAARATVRAAMQSDPDWQAAKELKRQVKKSTEQTREEIKALEAAAKERQADTEAGKRLESGRMFAGKLRKNIERKVGEYGQMMLPFFQEELPW
jgi:septal ring factor EnvC (AmiA/AmiB activator)